MMDEWIDGWVMEKWMVGQKDYKKVDAWIEGWMIDLSMLKR